MKPLLTPLLLLLLPPPASAVPALHYHTPFSSAHTTSRVSYLRHHRTATTSSCTNTSLAALVWTARDVAFGWTRTYSTPAHSFAEGFVVFNLWNPATAARDVETCSAYGFDEALAQSFDGSTWFGCSAGAAGAAGSAVFRFSEATGRVDVNQSWACAEAGSAAGAAADVNFFNATGTANVSLSCTTSTYQNPNWTMGQIFSQKSMTCGPANISVFPTTIAAWSATSEDGPGEGLRWGA